MSKYISLFEQNSIFFRADFNEDIVFSLCRGLPNAKGTYGRDLSCKLILRMNSSGYFLSYISVWVLALQRERLPVQCKAG